MINVLKSNISDFRDKVTDMTPRREKYKQKSSSSSTFPSPVETKEEPPDNKALLRIEELERLLLEKIEAHEESKDAFNKLKK